MQNILVIGSSNTDMVVKTSRFPQPGETILGGAFFMFSGGKGANQAVAAARLGGDVTFICKTGNDIFGQQATAGFQKENINIVYATVDNTAASGVAIITVNDAGENEIVVAPGANNCLNEEDINNAQPAFQAASVVLLQLEIPLHTVMPAADKAFTLHKKLIINPAPAQGLPESLLQKIYLITPNETEAEILTGIKISGIDAAEQAAAILLDKGVQNVIITMGANGAYFKNKTESFITAAPKVIAVDTTAAGDVFNGAVAVAIAENKPWKEAVDFACRAAAIAVSRMGAQTSAPYINEL